MRSISLISALLLLSLTACGQKSQDTTREITALPAVIDLSAYSRVHEFRTKDGAALAGLYGKSVDPEAFSVLLFVDERGNSRNVVYLLESNRFLGTHGLDTELSSTDFYGYKLTLKAPDYVVVNYTTNGGKNVSDDVTIRWKYELSRFELEKTP